MAPAFDFLKAVAEHVQKIVVGGEDFAARRKLDNCLGARDRIDLTLKLSIPELLQSGFRDDLDDLENKALRALHGIVGGLNPNLAPALGKAFVFSGLEFATPELRPERLI